MPCVQAMRTEPRAVLAQVAHQLDHRAATGDLVVEHDHVAPLDTSPIIAVIRTSVSLIRSPAPAATGVPRRLAKAAAFLALPRSGETTTALAEVITLELFGELAQRVQVIDRYAEKAVHLRGVQRHRQHPLGAGSGEEIGDAAGRRSRCAAGPSCRSARRHSAG